VSWVDIGVNLIDSAERFSAIVQRAQGAKVNQLILTGTSVSKSREAIILAEQYPQYLFTTVGVHPHHASEFDDHSYAELKTLADSNNVVAIGECGLDFNRNFSTPAAQLYAFECQLELAVELALPVFLHERDAFAAQISLLEKYRPALVGGVVHCFTGNRQQMAAYLDLDLHIGITGWVCDRNRGEALRDAVKYLALNKLLLETDAPYLRPKGLANNRRVDGGQNEPAYLPYIAQEVANLMGLSVAEIEQNSVANSHALFHLGTNHA
jgi:TatD DNase family protein